MLQLAFTALAALVPQTPFQQKHFESVASTAKAASDAALPHLEAALSSPKFLKELAKCCPTLVGSSPSALISRIADEVAVLEVVSGFPADDDGWDMSLDVGINASWLLNQWEVKLFENGSFSGMDWYKTQDDVETILYGLRPFSARGHPSSLAEASERGICDADSTLTLPTPPKPWPGSTQTLAPCLLLAARLYSNPASLLSPHPPSTTHAPAHAHNPHSPAHSHTHSHLLLTSLLLTTNYLLAADTLLNADY